MIEWPCCFEPVAVSTHHGGNTWWSKTPSPMARKQREQGSGVGPNPLPRHALSDLKASPEATQVGDSRPQITR